jgi:dTDP-4-dehydrorhamnose reductase
MKKLLVTGISGFLGQYFAKHKMNWEVHGTYHSTSIQAAGISLHQVDLTNAKERSELLNRVQPDAILHLAALSNPNVCEQKPAWSYAINQKVGLAFAKYAATKHIPYLFTSTDLVFKGDKAPYAPADMPAPIMTYGKDKYDAEKAILQQYSEATIARLPLLYGLGANFLPNWIKKLKNGEKVYAFTDEYRTPTYAADAVVGLLLLLEQKQTGIWHLGGKESISRFDFIRLAAKVFAFDESLILPSLQKDVKMPAARPANVSLDSSKTYEIGFSPKSIEENLQFIHSTKLH